VFVCTLFSGVALLIPRGAPVRENLIYPTFSMSFCVAFAMCAEWNSAVSTL
jgi:hypothetical protein